MVLLTTMATLNRHVSWIDYYIKALEELQGPSETVSEGYDAFNELVEKYLNDISKFNSSVETHPNFNFLLLPSSSKGMLNVVHCASLFDNFTDDSSHLAGVHGTRFNSPWKVINPDRKGYGTEPQSSVFSHI